MYRIYLFVIFNGSKKKEIERIFEKFRKNRGKDFEEM